MEHEKTIQIKGMVCDRCIKVVAKTLTDLGLEVRDIRLGSVTVVGVPMLVSIKMVEGQLSKHGFSLVRNQDAVAEEVKYLINELLDEDRVYEMQHKYATILTETLGIPYQTIKAHFVYAEGMTLEKYIIHQRLEKAKEFLAHTDFTFTEIAYILGFSSLQHLSNQFKEITGLSPSHFKKAKTYKKQIITYSKNSNG